MICRSTSLALVLTLVCVLTSPPCARALLSDPPVESLRLAIARGEMIAVGVVTALDIDNQNPQVRFSGVTVQEVLWGEIEAGDTVRVMWLAPRYQVDAKTEVIIAGKREPALLGRPSDVPGLFFLQQEDGRVRRSGIGPVVLEPGNREELQRMLSRLTDPVAVDRLTLALEDQERFEMWCGDVDRSTIDDKLAAVAEYLAGYLAGLAADEEDSAGRSN